MSARSKKILIIDDDQINNLICTRIIREYDQKIEVTSVTSGEKALTLLQNFLDRDTNELPNVILLDINMPVMNGWKFIEEYRKMNDDLLKKVNVYLLTSSRFQQDEELAGKYTEVKGFLTKPLSFNILDIIDSSNT